MRLVRNTLCVSDEWRIWRYPKPYSWVAFLVIIENSHQLDSLTEPYWVWLVLQDLAAELGYCKDTIFRYLHSLLELGVIERQRAHRWSTDRVWKYRIVSSKLALVY